MISYEIRSWYDCGQVLVVAQVHEGRADPRGHPSRPAARPELVRARPKI